MQRFKSFLFFISISTVGISQTTSIPDLNFELALIDLGIDSGAPDGQVTTADIETLTFLNVSQQGIINMEGIEDFSALQTLYCQDNLINNLIVDQNVNLEYLYCEQNELNQLNLNQNTALIHVNCSSNQLSSPSSSMSSSSTSAVAAKSIPV